MTLEEHTPSSPLGLLASPLFGKIFAQHSHATNHHQEGLPDHETDDMTRYAATRKQALTGSAIT